MAKTFRKALIGLEDLSLGVGSFNRATSTGGTQALTKISFGTGVSSIATTSAAAYSASISSLVLTNATSNAITVTLPTAVGNTGLVVKVKKTDSSVNIVTLATTSSQTIDGASTYQILLQNEVVTVMSDGSNWQVVG